MKKEVKVSKKNNQDKKINLELEIVDLEARLSPNPGQPSQYSGIEGAEC